MNILITGATGFAGRNLVKYLKTKHNVFALTRNESDTTSIDGCKCFTFDNNVSELAEFMTSNGISGIIHLATCWICEHNVEQISGLIAANITYGTFVLEACRMAGVKWMLNIGSIWQNYNSEPYSDAYHPTNLYAATKQAMMDIAQYYSEACGIRVCTLKLCDTYGPDDHRRKIYTLFREIAASGEALDMSPGEQLLDIVHIDDVVEGIAILADKLDNGEDLRQEYVLSSGNPMSIKDVAKRYEEAFNCKLNINWGGRPYRKREVMQPYRGNILPDWKPKKEIF